MKVPIIKTGFLVSYDWELLKKSVPRVYNESDSICFSLDRQRLSWAGNKFPFDDEAFYSWVKDIDKDNKITVYEDEFFVEGKTTIENDNRQRTLMSEFMGKGGWHVQIDADEYFIDFPAFKRYLLNINKAPLGTEKPVNICCNWISLIKRTERGYLYVKNKKDLYETMPFATNVPQYLNARHNGHFNHISPFFVLHETWARGEKDLAQKINNWGHDGDFISKQSYFELWKVLDEYNYIYIHDFHPIKRQTWECLDYVPEQEISALINWLEVHKKISISRHYLKRKNSRVIQGLKQRLRG